MPNHCWNVLTVVGPAEDVRAFVARAHGESPVWDQNFRNAKEKAAREGKPYNPFDVKPYISDLQFHALVPLTGYEPGMQYSDLGYHLEKREWGVKWGAYDVRRVYDGGTVARYTFTTAWAPAALLFQRVSTMFPSLTFALSFYAEGPSLGRLTWHAGIESIVAVKQDDWPVCPPGKEDDDAWYESVYLSWHRQYYDTHDEWVASLSLDAT